MTKIKKRSEIANSKNNVNEFLMTRSLDDVISNRRGSVQLKDKVLIATG